MRSSCADSGQEGRQEVGERKLRQLVAWSGMTGIWENTTEMGDRTKTQVQVTLHVEVMMLGAYQQMTVLECVRRDTCGIFQSSGNLIGLARIPSHVAHRPCTFWQTAVTKWWSSSFLVTSITTMCL